MNWGYWFAEAGMFAMGAGGGVRPAAFSRGFNLKGIYTPPVRQSISLKYDSPQPNGVSHSFTIKNGKLNIDGRATTSGKFDFVITNSGKLHIGSGHYHLSGGANSVQMAGRLKVYKGKVSYLNANSGHYRPSPSQAANGKKILNQIINGQ